LLLLGGLLANLHNPFKIIPATYAAPTTFQEDFSQGFTKWQLARGDMSLWSISGEQAKATVRTNSTITEIIPKDEYWNPNWHNLTIEFDYTPLQGIDRNLSFGYQDTSNWYDLHFVDSFYQLARVQGGVVTFSVFHNYVLANGKTYHMKLILNKGNIQLYIDGAKIIDETDWTFNDNFGKLSLKATTGAAFPTVVQFDNILVIPIADVDTQLNVPLLKQTDPQWKDQEYDQAHIWSPNKQTISSWGCALTSMAMILQSYGLNKLPDGQNLTPATLNTWLKQQVDGYIDGGEVNWNAATRLTRLINTAYGTTKLEYTRLAGNLTKVKTEILAARPAILEIPGHFLVASGLSVDQQTVFIKDPFYDYTQFSQHHANLASVRQFVPSMTDLSAILIAAPANVSISLADSGGDPLTSLQTWTEFIQDPSQTNGASSPTVRYILLSKPKTRIYDFKVTVTADNAASLFGKRVQIYTYNTWGDVNDLSQPLPNIAKELNFALWYGTTYGGSINSYASFHQLRTDLASFRQSGQIKSAAVFLQLDKLLSYPDQARPTDQASFVSIGRYLDPIQKMLDQDKTFMTAPAYQTLSAELKLLKAIYPTNIY